ncbi:30S ribosomal protein S11, chloroplastic [Datura stramonium]|uniref:30S ribosomal protein S11, chloroplastic n=1 Tax=Datura stramonium TaxID=4076 RepID=A0ABS8VDW5_DATST|nr:30S ribosomal protein S11, chloroplastic [Datura stramonium]
MLFRHLNLLDYISTNRSRTRARHGNARRGGKRWERSDIVFYANARDRVKIEGACGSHHGVIHVQASFNNTIVTITDVRHSFLVLRWYVWIQRYEKRNTVCCSNRSSKRYPYSSGSRYANEQEVKIKGPVWKRCSITSYSSKWYTINCRDVTSVGHNGCRPPKKRRVELNIEEISREIKDLMI